MKAREAEWLGEIVRQHMRGWHGHPHLGNLQEADVSEYLLARQSFIYSFLQLDEFVTVVTTCEKLEHVSIYFKGC